MIDVYNDSCENHWTRPDIRPLENVDVSGYVHKLEFQLSDNLKNTITAAKDNYRKLCDSLDLSELEYFKMNKDFLKRCKLSPDAVIQLALQIGFYKQYGFTPCTYESCSTAAFRKGRTETMRPATSETKRAVEAFLSKDKPSNDELAHLIKAASKKHGQLVREASMGQGFDRHLFGLKVTAERLNRPIPEIFTDETYSVANHFTLSTSTLSTDKIILGGFGAVVPDGYGVGYNVGEHRMGMVVSAYPPNRNPQQFVETVEESLDEIYEVLNAKSD